MHQRGVQCKVSNIQVECYPRILDLSSPHALMKQKSFTMWLYPRLYKYPLIVSVTRVKYYSSVLLNFCCLVFSWFEGWLYKYFVKRWCIFFVV